MRKILMLLGLVAALAIPAAALAATLDTGKFGDFISNGDKCSSGAWYHFVNNQTGGASAGTLTTSFSNPSDQFPGNDVGPLAVNQNVQHFYVWSKGHLDSASTNLPGKLVISGYACGKKHDNPRDLIS
jgi:hypothetical protein